MAKAMWAMVPAAIAVGVAFLFFFVLPGASEQDPAHAVLLARLQFAQRAASQAAGVVITVAGLLVIFGHAVRLLPAGDTQAAGLCVLGGALLVDPQGSIALAFGLLAVAPFVVRPITTPAGGSGTQ